MPSVLTDAEVQSLRAHLGYGNVSTGAYPYTPDGWHEVFSDVIAPNLQTGEETTSSTTVAAGSATIVVASATDVVAHARLVIDVGDAMEVVVVRAVSGVNVTATFAAAHSGTYPVALMSGLARLRMLLHAADKAWLSLQSPAMASTAGIKRVEGDVEFFEPRSSGATSKMTGTRAHYESIVSEISSLVRVLPRWARDRGGVRQTEVY
jgi:hypothetical protein